MRYGSEWRKNRRLFHQFFHGDASKQYRPSHVLESRKILLRLLSSPDLFLHHVRQYVGLMSYWIDLNECSSSLAASSIMRVTYGIEVNETNDKYISTAEKAMYVFSTASEPGAFVVDYLPIRKMLNPTFCLKSLIAPFS